MLDKVAHCNKKGETVELSDFVSFFLIENNTQHLFSISDDGIHYTDINEIHNDNVEELDMRFSYDFVIMANYFLTDFHDEDAGMQHLQKMDTLSSGYFISRSGMDSDGER